MGRDVKFNKLAGSPEESRLGWLRKAGIDHGTVEKVRGVYEADGEFAGQEAAHLAMMHEINDTLAKIQASYGEVSGGTLAKSAHSMPTLASEILDRVQKFGSHIDALAAQPMPGGPVRRGPVSKELDGVDLSNRNVGDALMNVFKGCLQSGQSFN